MTEVSILLLNRGYNGLCISREGMRWLYDNHRELAMFDGLDDFDKWSYCDYYDHLDELRVCPELIRAHEEGVDDIKFINDWGMYVNVRVETMPKVYYENDFYEILCRRQSGAEYLCLNHEKRELSLAAAVIPCIQHILYGEHDMDALEMLRLLVPPSADCTMSKLAQNVQYLPGLGVAFKEGEDEFNQMKHGE
jgi:hypothetical protein